MKLLAKNAEDRYQTGAGLTVDLRKCLAEWESNCRIDPFPLGANDASDRLMAPEKLYGREHEIGTAWWTIVGKRECATRRCLSIHRVRRRGQHILIAARA
jgi:hypothetical protein